MTSVPNSTTQRDELAAILINHDTSRGHFFGSPGLCESRADALLDKYILIPRPTVGEARRGNHQVILIDGIGVTSDAAWLRSKLGAEEMAMEACAHRSERIRAALAYLDTEAAAQAESKLQERRDAVKTELVKALLNSTGPTDVTRAAIDRIIELEDAAEATR